MTKTKRKCEHVCEICKHSQELREILEKLMKLEYLMSYSWGTTAKMNERKELIEKVENLIETNYTGLFPKVNSRMAAK